MSEPFGTYATCHMVEFIFEKYVCYWLLHQFKLMKKTILGLPEI
jgi:hypothetical protein